MQASIQVSSSPEVQYLLRIGDTALVLGQRIAEWTGHAPVLEEDIALANMALDLIGQCRAVLAHAGTLEGAGHDEDQLAFLREERDYRNVTLAELPRGDFAFTTLRNAMMATFFKLLWERLAHSADAEVAGIAGKAVKEARYHQQHAADWLLRLAGGTGESRRRVEKALAFLREERDYRNVTLAELPRGDFAFTTLRNAMMATFFKLLWERLAHSADAEVAGIAGKAVKEARYHQQHAADWLLRLAGGTDESRRRVEKALAELWPYSAELFAADAVDDYAQQSGLGPRWSELREPWMAEMTHILDEAGLAAPAAVAFLSTGKTGVHSEHMGFLLTELQYLQRAYPGGVW